MSTQEFLTNVSLILVIMALLAVGELALPMIARRPALPGRRTANFGLTLLTLALNWGLTSAVPVLAFAFPLILHELYFGNLGGECNPMS